MKNVKTNKGITLIALVVTIIVLLILAAVTIGLVLGQNGIIGKANKAKNATDIASGKDQVQLALAKVVSDKLEDGKTTSDIKAEDLQTELQKIDSSASVTGTNPNFTVKYKVNGTEYEYGINTSTQTVTAPEFNAEEWDRTATDESYFIWANDVINIEELNNPIGYAYIYYYRNTDQYGGSPDYIFDLLNIYKELDIQPKVEPWGEYYYYKVNSIGSNEDYTNEYTVEQQDIFMQKVKEKINSVIIGYNSEVQNLYELKIPSRCTGITCQYMLADGPSREILGQGVRKVEMPSTVVEIGENAFKEFTKLKEINIPNCVTKIGRGAFDGCESLEAIKIPDRVTELGAGAFRNCTKLSNIVIPENITIISEYTFSGTNISSITIPKKVEQLKLYSFTDCINLQTIRFCGTPENVPGYGNSAFDGCNIKNVIYEDGITNISDLTKGKGINIQLPNTVTSIENYAFSNYGSIECISIPNSVVDIGEDVFYKYKNFIVYTNNQTVINYINSNYTNITIKPYEESPNL